MFGSRVYAESLYWFSAIATALSNIQQSEIIDKKEGNEIQTTLTEKELT
jgi:hypothetical protein